MNKIEPAPKAGHPHPEEEPQGDPRCGARRSSPPTAFAARPSTASPRKPACRSRTSSIISPARRRSIVAVLEDTLEEWLQPLAELDPAGDPVERDRRYIEAKLEMSRARPAASRLFANEILHGAPAIGDFLNGPLKALVDEKSAVIAGWCAEGTPRARRSAPPDHDDLGGDAALRGFRRAGGGGPWPRRGSRASLPRGGRYAHGGVAGWTAAALMRPVTPREPLTVRAAENSNSGLNVAMLQKNEVIAGVS